MTALVVAWLSVIAACGASVWMIVRARRSRAPIDALSAAGAGCATFVVGVGVMLFVLAEASRRLASIDDARLEAAQVSARLEQFSPPGYLALGFGFAVVCVGAWLRADAREEPRSRN